MFSLDDLVDTGIPAIFALACGYPSLFLLHASRPLALAVTLVIAVPAFVGCRAALRWFSTRAADKGFEQFDLRSFQPACGDTPIARPTAANDGRHASAVDAILEAAGPQSRVVRLFGVDPVTPAAAAELAKRFDRDLAGSGRHLRRSVG